MSLANAPRRFVLHLHGARELDLIEVAAVWLVVLDTVPPDDRGEDWWTLADAAHRELGELARNDHGTALGAVVWARLYLKVWTDGVGWIEAIQ